MRLLCAAACVAVLLCLLANGEETPSGFEPVQRALLEFMESQHLPGASIAVAKNGHLVFARGYGLADIEAGVPVRPESLFRIGSIGKTITSIAAMKLVESGRLNLDARVFEVLDDIRPRSGRIRDARASKITVREILQHSGGWDRALSGDPMIYPRAARIASELGVQYPPTCAATISYMLDQPLDFEPGTRFGYSNFGYCVMGMVIEKVTGRSYFEFVTTEVLAPLGITGMQLARTTLAGRAPGEVRYYDYPGAPLVDSFLRGVEGKVPVPYCGSVPFEGLASAGGLIGTAVDLVRLYVGLEASRPPASVSPESLASMLWRPDYELPAVGYPNRFAWPGLGVGVESSEAGFSFWHDGGGTGTGIETFVFRHPDGIVWAAMFNSAPKDDSKFTESLRQVFDPDALASVEWPNTDEFPQYHRVGRPELTSECAVNSASWLPGPIAPGELITIQGTFFGDREEVSRSENADASATKVLVNGIPAPLLYVSPSQINAAAPFALATDRTAEIKVRSFGYESAPCSRPISAANPALFTVDGTGTGPVVAFNGDGRPNGPTQPARPDEVLTLWATGLGLTSPAARDGWIYSDELPAIQLPVRARIDGQEAEVLRAHVAAGSLAGVAEVAIRIPNGLMAGSGKITLTVGDFTGSSAVTVALAGSPSVTSGDAK